jgi:AcrR family transcriptional regulator
MPMNSNPDNTPEDTRQRILRAAMKLFGQVGYAQASTRAIAEAAGVNEVTLFRHFGSKKNLLMACTENFNAASFSGTFETQLSGDYAEDILRMARLQIKDTAEHMELLRLLISDAHHIPELREIMLSGGRGNAERLRRYFLAQIEAGVVRPDQSADALESAFDGMFSWTVILENLFRDNPAPWLPPDDLVRAMVDLFVRGTRA